MTKLGPIRLLCYAVYSYNILFVFRIELLKREFSDKVPLKQIKLNFSLDTLGEGTL